VFQQRKLAARHGNRPPSRVARTTGNHDVAERERGDPGRAPLDAPDARRQLAHTERLVM
jgi:hypothetical protein